MYGGLCSNHRLNNNNIIVKSMVAINDSEKSLYYTINVTITLETLGFLILSYALHPPDSHSELLLSRLCSHLPGKGLQKAHPGPSARRVTMTHN